MSSFTADRHLPLPGPRFVDWLLRFGYPLERLPAERWRAALIDSLEAGRDNALAPFLPLYKGAAAAAAIAVDNAAPARQGGAPLVHYGCRGTSAALAGSGVGCPPVEELLAIYFRHFVATGFLPPPALGPADGARPGSGLVSH